MAPDQSPAPGTCTACGHSLAGVSYRADCPGCGTPAAMSLPAEVPVAAEASPVIAGRDDALLNLDHPCAGCGKNIRGLPAAGFCGRCGTPVRKSLAVEHSDAVTEDRPCLICGYNLRNLAFSGACPECGTPIERSLRGALFQYSAPEYLARLHRGLFLTELTVAIKGLAWLPLFYMRFAFSGLAAQSAFDVGELALTGVMLFGWWLLTEPDPALENLDSSVDRSRRPRRAVRVVVLAWIAATVGLTVYYHMPGFRASLQTAMGGSGAGTPMVGLFLPWSIQSFMALLSSIFLCWYFKELAPRVPDRGLAQRATTNRWLLPVLFGVGSPGLFCCPAGMASIAGVILFVTMLDPWRAAIKKVRTLQAGEPAPGPRPPAPESPSENP